MANLRLKRPTDGHITVTPQSAGWTYVGFEVLTLEPGIVYPGATGDKELCIVLITGRAEVSVEGEVLGEIGERLSPFEGKPAAAYVPAGKAWSIKARSRVEIGLCTAPGGGAYAPHIIDVPDQITRGKGSNTRYVTNILPETAPAHSLLVVEVITPGGNTSSYPPHKHDTENLPHESFLEETYYHRLNPPQGFAVQRVYTDDRSLDEALVIEDGDVTLVPKGYHPVGTMHGYDLYYLNVMAGPVRTWKFHNAVEHEWLLE